MNRRGFFKRLGLGLAAAALAANAELGALVPVFEFPAKKEIWYYLVEVTDHWKFKVAVQHVWMTEEEIRAHGMKPEDFLSLEPGQHLGRGTCYIDGPDGLGDVEAPKAGILLPRSTRVALARGWPGKFESKLNCPDAKESSSLISPFSRFPG